MLEPMVAFAPKSVTPVVPFVFHVMVTVPPVYGSELGVTEKLHVGVTGGLLT
jgi:hypothetical protein